MTVREGSLEVREEISLASFDVEERRVRESSEPLRRLGGGW